VTVVVFNTTFQSVTVSWILIGLSFKSPQYVESESTCTLSRDQPVIQEDSFFNLIKLTKDLETHQSPKTYILEYYETASTTLNLLSSLVNGSSGLVLKPTLCMIQKLIRNYNVDTKEILGGFKEILLGWMTKRWKVLGESTVRIFPRICHLMYLHKANSGEVEITRVFCIPLNVPSSEIRPWQTRAFTVGADFNQNLILKGVWKNHAAYSFILKRIKENIHIFLFLRKAFYIRLSYR
jgi:hypothetical protein